MDFLRKLFLFDYKECTHSRESIPFGYRSTFIEPKHSAFATKFHGMTVIMNFNSLSTTVHIYLTRLVYCIERQSFTLLPNKYAKGDAKHGVNKSFLEVILNKKSVGGLRVMPKTISSSPFASLYASSSLPRHIYKYFNEMGF